MHAMNALKHIRVNVFGLKQQEFAALAGVLQSRVSRWESGEAVPTLEEMHRIRTEARNRKLKAKWSDQLFFAAPQEADAA